MKKAIKAIISGQVQGVGFRYFAAREATLLGITGYVRNLYDGSVEVLAQGESDMVDCFLSILKEGPRFSKVTHVHREETNLVTKYDHFNIDY